MSGLRAACALLCLCACVLRTHATHPPAPEYNQKGQGKLILHYVDDFASGLAYTDAVCNDGTPGGFYYANATDPTKDNIWLVYLEGGQWCYDEFSCTERRKSDPALTSSKFPTGQPRWPIAMDLNGIFSVNPHRNPWAGAHQVYVGYCSSDAWAGNIAAADTPLAGLKNVGGTLGWAFKGQRIIEALFAVLASDFGFGSASNTRLLFSGCSAGSRGAMFNLDYIQPLVPPGVEVRGFFDSPMWVDIQPFDPTVVPLENQTQSAYNLINATGRLGQACVQAFSTQISPGVYDTSQLWKCLFGQYRIVYVQTPFLVSSSQFDKYQLPYNEGGPPPYDAAQLAYALTFQSEMLSVMESLPTKQQAGSAAFSSACFKHCTSNLNSFWGVFIGDTNLKDFLNLWYFGDTTPSKRRAGITFGGASPSTGVSMTLIEQCTGFGCGQCHNMTPSGTPELTTGATSAAAAAVGRSGKRSKAAMSSAPSASRAKKHGSDAHTGRGTGLVAVLMVTLGVAIWYLQRAQRAQSVAPQRYVQLGPLASENTPLRPGGQQGL